MDIELADDIAPEGEQRKILESIIRDTGNNFDELLEFAEIDQINVGGPEEYRDFYSRPMDIPGSSPPLWRHNPFSEGEIKFFVNDPTHVPHEMAHQIENIYNQIEKASETDTRNFETKSAAGRTFSESFAYLNQLKYFPKMPEFYSVEFDGTEELREDEISWQRYSNSPTKHPDLHHTAGYQAALQLHEEDIDPVNLLEEPEKYRQVAEDAVTAAWIEARNNGDIDRNQYNEVVEKSVESRLEK